MTDEEIAKALNDLKELSMTNYYGDMYFAEQAGTKLALKYIEKLQKENEEYHRIKKDLIRVNKKIYDVEAIDEFIKTIEKLQKENKESKELYDKLFNGYNKLVQEHLELEKTIDLIIDDFQAENYFVGMTNKEVREYYKKRKELNE